MYHGCATSSFKSIHFFLDKEMLIYAFLFSVHFQCFCSNFISFSVISLSFFKSTFHTHSFKFLPFFDSFLDGCATVMCQLSVIVFLEMKQLIYLVGLYYGLSLLSCVVSCLTSSVQKRTKCLLRKEHWY